MNSAPLSGLCLLMAVVILFLLVNHHPVSASLIPASSSSSGDDLLTSPDVPMMTGDSSSDEDREQEEGDEEALIAVQLLQPWLRSLAYAPSVIGPDDRTDRLPIHSKRSMVRVRGNDRKSLGRKRALSLFAHFREPESASVAPTSIVSRSPSGSSSPGNGHFVLNQFLRKHTSPWLRWG